MSDFDYRTSPELSAEYAKKAEGASQHTTTGEDDDIYSAVAYSAADAADAQLADVLSTVDEDNSIVDSNGPDQAAHSLATLADLQAITQQLDDHGRMLADLHAKVDHLNNGMGAVYAGVDHLVKMLSAVQQVASMMPGGKKLAQAMQKNGEQ